jgi:hypothetical protein
LDDKPPRLAASAYQSTGSGSIVPLRDQQRLILWLDLELFDSPGMNLYHPSMGMIPLAIG